MLRSRSVACASRTSRRRSRTYGLDNGPIAAGYLLQADYDDAINQAQAAAIPK